MGIRSPPYGQRPAQAIMIPKPITDDTAIRLVIDAYPDLLVRGIIPTLDHLKFISQQEHAPVLYKLNDDERIMHWQGHWFYINYREEQ
ncbi:MAG: hypothetical protein ACYCPX_12800 [Acidiferrobacteraceae bacterium]